MKVQILFARKIVFLRSYMFGFVVHSSINILRIMLYYTVTTDAIQYS